ncbi:acyl-homoserine-lactone synthase [Notoacmeibacter ruber]|uniref:Acyl-homoserine-lactone synthase n=1 Tax=Notoacmeibacter ruber TaxID=2670375 RepID=A0A3L7JEQ1_9HYPH|nr:acyl-homoserine-lactone synthase [Notoacmeibacter ruber]RLQ88934.1 GNAT family N-acetyltransferase [Notoacmeibacter ruber]
MLRIVQGHGSNIDERLILDGLYRYRHAVFVDYLGWTDLARKDKREFDPFDDEHTTHFAVVIDRRLVAYCRTRSTIYPHLLSDAYPQLLRGAKVPRGPHIAEWSRGTVLPDLRKEGIEAYSVAAQWLYLGVVEWAYASGYNQFSLQITPDVIPYLWDVGIEVDVLARETEFGGAKVVPLLLTISERTLSRMRSFFDVTLPPALMDQFSAPQIATSGRKEAG